MVYNLEHPKAFALHPKNYPTENTSPSIIPFNCPSQIILVSISSLLLSPLVQDSEVFYDLKHLLEESKMPVPPQLANHEAAKQKPGGFERKRDSVVFAKK